MKYFLIFLIVCVALAVASPQFVAWPGYAGVVPARTVVAGPTVVNDVGARFWPGYTTII